MVKVRVSPGFRLGSPVSPALVPSSTLSAPLLTGAGGSPESAIGSLSKAVSVLRTVHTRSTVPGFLTVRVTSPAGAVALVDVTVIGALRPLVSLNATETGPGAPGVAGVAAA